MNAINTTDDPKWVAALKREAENQRPSFSQKLHAQIMRKVAARSVKTGSSRPTLRAWILRPRAEVWSLAATAILVVVGVLFIHAYLPITQVTDQRPTAPVIDISSLLPDSGLLIDQTATQWQRQFSAQRYIGLQTQAQLLTRYVVRKITLF
ncbi:MAG: hypothetical protein ACP5VQ_08140 [Phycisphaerae bacterium]